MSKDGGYDASGADAPDSDSEGLPPAVSIVMANYNGAHYLRDAIQSVQRQTFVRWELLVVDDASTDDSVMIARAMARDDPRIRVFVQSLNGGPGAARNRALDKARGQWIAIFDSDDVMAPDRVATLVAFARRTSAMIVADNQMICGSDLRPQELFLRPGQIPEDHVVGLAQFVDSSRLYSPVPDLGFLKPLISRAAIARTGARYDEALKIGEDFHFMLLLLTTGLDIHIEPRPLYQYRKHGSSISHRLSQETLRAITEADEAFCIRAGSLSLATRNAFHRRRAGILSWMAYDRMVERMKAGQPIQAAREIVSRPHAWRLMSRLFAVRLTRLARRLASRSA